MGYFFNTSDINQTFIIQKDDGENTFLITNKVLTYELTELGLTDLDEVTPEVLLLFLNQTNPDLLIEVFENYYFEIVNNGDKQVWILKDFVGGLLSLVTISELKFLFKDNKVITNTSQLNNDGSDGQTPFITLEDLVGDKNYVHNQNVAQTVWEIIHNLGKYPSVVVVDSGNNVVIGDISYIDLNSISLSFSTAFSGKAFFN
jgi:hypothetical protein